MRTKAQKKRIVRGHSRQHVLAVLVTLCLVLNYLNFGLMVTYASSSGSQTFPIGGNVTAELTDGTLTLSGTGETEDFQAETAPFRDYAGDIHTLVIEDGITYIGAYLFYGLDALGGRLTLPESIVGFGDYAFSGDGSEAAPYFTIIENLFSSGEVVRQGQPAPEPPLGGGEPPADTQTPQEEGTPAVQPSVPAEPEPEIPVVNENEGEPPRTDDTENELPEDGQPELETPGASEPQVEPGTGNPVEEGDAPQQAEGSDENPEHETECAPEVSAPEAEPETGDAPTAQPAAENDATAAASNLAGMPVRHALVYRAAFEPAPVAGRPVPLAATPPGMVEAADGENGVSVGNAGGAENDGNNGGITAQPDAGSPTGGAGSPGELEELTHDRYSVAVITEQEIAHPDTLFYQGRSGAVICSKENKTFLEAALSAGYQLADDMATVTLDDKIKMELPVADGLLVLPECPVEISSPYENNAFLTYIFSGWAEDPGDESAPALLPDELLPINGTGSIFLYSVWDAKENYALKTLVETDGDSAVYTLLDSATSQALIAPDEYEFRYQWQIAEQGEGASVSWTAIDGANESVYRRALNPMDSGKQLRCE